MGRHLKVHFLFRFLFALSLMSSRLCIAQDNSTDDALADAVVPWDIDCSNKGCLVETDVLRGDSGAAPDSKDFREYIGIYIAIDRKDKTPAYFAFHVDPRSQKDQGVFVGFAKSVQDGPSWKIVRDPVGVSRLSFSSCDERSCVARIPGGVVEEGKDRHAMNLLDKFLTANFLWVLYMKDGRPYRTLIDLDSFKKTYQRVIDIELAAQKPN